MKYSNKIDKYLDGELAGNELSEFENKLLTNPELAKRVNKYRKLSEFVKREYEKSAPGKERTVGEREKLDEIINNLEDYNGEIDEEKIESLRNKLEIAHELYESKSPYKKHPHFWLLAAAVIVMFITTTVLVSHFKVLHVDNEKLFNKYYMPYTEDIYTRIITVDKEDSFIRALRNYVAQEYEEALTVFDQISEDDKNYLPARFYSGIIHMEKKRYSDAILSFRSILDHEPNELINGCNWYLGLCYMKLNENDMAQSCFRKIINSNSIYNKPSKKILKKLAH